MKRKSEKGINSIIDSMKLNYNTSIAGDSCTGMSTSERTQSYLLPRVLISTSSQYCLLWDTRPHPPSTHVYSSWRQTAPPFLLSGIATRNNTGGWMCGRRNTSNVYNFLDNSIQFTMATILTRLYSATHENMTSQALTTLEISNI